MKEQSIRYLEDTKIDRLFCSQKTATRQENHIRRRYRKGEYIYMPNEYADKIYFIASGKIKIGAYSSDGKEITKAILNMGEVFGELALIGEERRRDFAVAMEATEICLMTIKEMKILMKERSGLEYFIMKIIGSRLLKMEKRLESLVFKDSRTRIVDFLKELAVEKGMKVGYEILVQGFFTHQEIANLTATSRQTVTTVLNDLRKQNIIFFNRRKLLIRDLSKLA